VLSHSPFLTELSRIAAYHHERLDGSGYHRGVEAPGLGVGARLLAAADAFHTKTEPRPYRAAMSREAAADLLRREADAGRLDPSCVAAVVTAAGLPKPKTTRPCGLTDREEQVLGLVARGLQTKQVARALGISTKTADRHIQNTYAKIGVSTRAAAAVFAMRHGLVAWGELPMAGEPTRS
jgi:DNA-binding CsgD family transcriptional regulator